ncbi:hypothetical protein KJ840_02905 [Patescibacteria group bacterium]|nr:hypothetical protein [Patescibacteria group bacterium]
MKTAIITGTGMSGVFTASQTMGLPIFNSEPKNTTTPYGSIRYHIVSTGSRSFILVDRHYCTVPYRFPHMIDHRAYMYMLYKSGVEHIFATTAVGGVNWGAFQGKKVGSLVMPDDLVDLTAGVYTFADEGFVHPTAFYRSAKGLLCPQMQSLITDEAVLRGGVLTCIIGPGYETPAELAFYCNSIPGLSLLGMTVAGEARLAREMAAHYLPIGIVADLPLEDSSVDGEGVERAVKHAQVQVVKAILTAMGQLEGGQPSWNCDCQKKPAVFKCLE